MRSTSSPIRALLRQGWISLAIWIAFRILMEGLVGYRIPALLDDLIRREMFRLAHAYGALLSIVLIIAAICVRLKLIQIGRFSALGLQCAAVLLPIGFLLGGLWQFRDDPGVGIFLVPIGALTLLAAPVSIALSVRYPGRKIAALVDSRSVPSNGARNRRFHAGSLP